MSDEGRCLRFVCFLISARKEDWFDPKENQLWIFIGRTNTETEAPILWPPNEKSWLTGKKIPDSGKDWGQGEKGATENEMVGWRHQLNGQEIEKDREAWCATGHGVSKSQMWLSNWTIKENTDYQLEASVLHLVASDEAMKYSEDLND